MPLKKGQQAPFDGQLLTPTLALVLGQSADNCDARMVLEVDRTQGIADADAVKAKAICQAESDALSAQLKQANEALARAQKLAEETAAPWYAQPWFVAPATAVITASAIIWVVRH